MRTTRALIIGNSEFGKSTLLEILTEKSFVPTGKQVGVLDLNCPAREDKEAYEAYVAAHWPGCWVTNDRGEFEAVFWESFNAIWCIDEGAEAVGKQAGQDVKWIATRGSHHRLNSVYVVTHRWKELDSTFRSQFTEIFLFNCAKSDASDLADEYDEALSDANKLGIGEFYHRRPGEAVTKWAIDFDKRTLKRL